MKLPEPVSRTFTGLIADIENGQIKIPQFQREFVWDINKSAKLMDSIVKGYPIGTFIFWKTNERLRAVRNLGDSDLPEPDEGDFIDYVLDGQQRLTSLFATLKGLKIERNGKVDNYDEVYINLDADEDDEIVIIDKENYDQSALIRLTDLLYGPLSILFGFNEKYHSKLQEYKTRIEAYSYSIILIRDAELDVATEIFTRINEGGKALTVFEIMVAKTFDAKKDFDLAEKYDALIENLSSINYETISDATVLQTVSILLEKECTRKTILKLDKKKFIEIWDSAVDAIEKAAEYFKGYYRIPVSQLLPYNSLIIPFSYFFYHHKDKPTGIKQKYLQDFFWRVSLATRYSSGVEGKIAQDIKRIDKILNEELPYYDWTIDYSVNKLEQNGWFSTGSSWIKSLLCIYAHQQPKSFNDDSIVNISNDWLKQANSKNYHHFFPKAFLEKKIDWEHKQFWINHILNITIVDDFLNKREIGAKAPSIYMKKFNAQNTEIKSTMKTHLIGDLDKFGIWDDDYGKFLKERARLLNKEINKRIIPQEADNLSEELEYIE
ncbi:DUF262 domain-containing protein [Elizabethkingia anophelis]|uniref:DUF262 domain-containing protein n=1 Tax=Elizabethkingia anophelis TaxID=1117645 RepID=UPI0020B2289A|nr:DUF262 domain-containing protein [Elizabethkingia anophelis]MCT3721810.1 DUF262 domain-containing protein [Elizabethkingia anophelis]MCT3725367.1 DUF262 domain-containing protein [Elizabethkingia anophelis]MCT3778492.1 DUF262 domain-containing protein [Elizabethkingia anophelis]MCT3785611.1 DUF262 domain-containing protein [Elizabethkingia anophelis]MCT3792839.1 DUF262 domain-containing protein [Elizabethkingia anophelis]